MNTREEFLKHCETFEIESFNDRTLAKFAWEACEKLMLEKMQSQKEYYEIVMQDGGKRIAELEEKLKVAREDTKRLEYLADPENGAQIIYRKYYGQDGKFKVVNDEEDITSWHLTFRDAIDEAREALNTIEW